MRMQGSAPGAKRWLESWGDGEGDGPISAGKGWVKGGGVGDQKALSRYSFREKHFMPLSTTKLGFMSEVESIFKT